MLVQEMVRDCRNNKNGTVQRLRVKNKLQQVKNNVCNVKENAWHESL